MSDSELNILFLLSKVVCNDGIASYCDTLSNGLAKGGGRFYIVSGIVYVDEQSRRRKHALESNAIEWRIYPRLRLIPRIGELIALAKFVRERDIRVIHVHGLSMLLWGRVLSVVTGAQLIATYHPSAWGDLQNVRAMAAKRLNAAQRIFLNLLFPDKLIVLSEESRKFIERGAPSFKN